MNESLFADKEAFLYALQCFGIQAQPNDDLETVFNAQSRAR